MRGDPVDGALDVGTGIGAFLGAAVEVGIGGGGGRGGCSGSVPPEPARQAAPACAAVDFG
jgi:hypothetical protein